MQDKESQRELDEDETWEQISHVATDLYHQHTAAKRGLPIPGWSTDRLTKLRSSVILAGGRIQVTIEDCLDHEILVGTVPDTQENRDHLAKLRREEETVIPALRACGYPV